MTAIRIISLVLSCIALCFSTFCMIWTFTRYAQLVKQKRGLEKKLRKYEEENTQHEIPTIWVK